MIRFAICDDDIENLKYMKKQIQDAFLKHDKKDIEIILYQTGQELVDANIADQIDVVFMDIELENNTLGFTVARQLSQQKKNIAIVYMSNHDHYVSKSFVCRPLGFIRKHHAKEDLEMVMEEVLLFIKEECRTLTFYNNSKSIELDVKEIYSVEVFNHELHITLKDKKLIIIRDQMLKHVTELEENGFVFTRRGVAVNARYIEEIKDSNVILTNEKVYSIGREYTSKVKQQWLNKRFF